MVELEHIPELKKQNDPAFPEKIQRFGCRFFDLLAIPQIHLTKALTAQQILDIYSRGLEYGQATPSTEDDDDVLTDICNMGTEEHLVITWAFEVLGAPQLRGRQIGRMKGDTPVYWNVKQPWQYIIGHWDTGSKDGHWTLRNAQRFEIYDSWWPGFDPNGHQIKKILTDKEYLYRVWEADA